ncbi:MAG: hypothetical protein RLZZ215_46 [Pseudomonadota bacterium]|jgi:type I restriction enzyme S subunit
MVLNNGWCSLETEQVFEQISTNDKKVKTIECLEKGLYPVIDQGQGKIAGYINDIAKTISVDKPLVIFGDHTRAIKWVDYRFVPGADGTKILKAKAFVDPRFLYYQLSSIELPDKGYARHFKELKEANFLVPSFAEQQEIATRLDDLLAQVDAIKARLDAIPAILKRFRQAVLAAAVSGKLTEDWRVSHTFKSYKPEEKNLENFKGQSLYDVPEFWQWLAFDKVAIVASNLVDPLLTPNASHIAPNHIESGTGRLLEYTTIAEDKVTSGKHQFYAGQILYSKIRPYLCKVAVVDFDGLCSADMYPINTDMNTKYLFYWMLSAYFTDWASNAESRSILPKINQKDLGKIPTPVPPLKEQTEIVNRVEQLFAFADQIEQQVQAAQTRVNQLTQAILAKAFKGELTAAWRAAHPELISGEHSAEALLEKIKVSQIPAKPKRGKTTNNTLSLLPD